MRNAKTNITEKQKVINRIVKHGANPINAKTWAIGPSVPRDWPLNQLQIGYGSLIAQKLRRSVDTSQSLRSINTLFPLFHQKSEQEYA